MTTPVRTRSEERGAELAASLEDPALTPFLPGLVVAWADGDLTEDEIAEIRERVQAHHRLPEAVRRRLELWLDPEQPPNTTDFERLLSRILEQSGEEPPGDGRSLMDLGVELGRGGPIGAPESEERAVLSELLSAVGSVGREALRLLPLGGRLVRSGDGARADESERVGRIDIAALHDLLEPDHHELRDGIRDLLRSGEFHPREDWSRQEYREAVAGWCRELADAGYGALAFPERHGGADDLGGSLAVFETLALGDLSLLVKFGVQFGLFGGTVLRLGTEHHHERWLSAIGAMELPGAFAMTETGHGSDVQSLETTATYDASAGEFVIHTPHEDARKDYIGNALQGRMAVAFAQLEVGGQGHGVHALVVPLRDEAGALLPGVRVTDCGEKAGLNGVDNGRIAFDQVRVPREALLDRFAAVTEQGHYESPIASDAKRFFTTIGTLVHGRVAVALAGLSAAKTALAIAVRYGDRRRQFKGAEGEPELLLLDYPTHQRRLLIPLAHTYALNFALHHLVERDVEVSTDEQAGEIDGRQLESLAAGLKAASTWHAMDTIQTCREACGGAGYLAQNRFGALRDDVDVFTTFEGDNTVLLQLVAKGLLTEYRQQFADMNLLKAISLFADRASSVIAERNPMAGRSTDEEHLRDRDFHLEAFRWRAEHSLAALGRRLRTLLSDGTDATTAFLTVQDHVLATARAHVDQVLIEQLAAAVGRCPDGNVRPVLSAVCDLHALARMEADRAWFLEHGQFASNKAKAVRRQVTQICAELRPHAVDLVDAFAIPDQLLLAPIAVDR